MNKRTTKSGSLSNFNESLTEYEKDNDYSNKI